MFCRPREVEITRKIKIKEIADPINLNEHA
jgi:hypothetical protein